MIRSMVRQQSRRPFLLSGCQYRSIRQHPCQITVEIKIVGFSSFNYAVDHCAALRAMGRGCKQKILPFNHKWLYATFRQVVA